MPTPACGPCNWRPGPWDQPLHATGITVDAGLLAEMLAAPTGDDGRPQLRDIDRTRATFGDVAGFNGATFGHGAEFDRATFGGCPEFECATSGPVLLGFALLALCAAASNAD